MNIFLFWYGNESKYINLKKYWNNIFENKKNIKLIYGPTDNEHNFLLKNYEYYKQALNEKKYALMADIWRLWKLSNNNGLYIDILTKVNEQKIFNFLEQLESKNKFFSIKENKYYINPFIIYSTLENNEIIKETLQRYKKYTNIKKILNIELIPLQVTYYFKNNKIKIQGWEKFENEKYWLEPLSIVNPNNKENIFYGNFSGSWKNKNNNNWEKTFSNYEKNKHKNLYVKTYMFLWWHFNFALNVILFFTNWTILKRNLSLKK